MKILFTGASSFSGMWFTEALVERGHDVTALLLRQESAYEGIRRQRVQRLKNTAQLIFDCPFGSDTFIQTIQSQGPFDLLCHHAADVTDYKSPNFDFAQALMHNTRNIKRVMEMLKAQNCTKILLTGSVFEPHEGIGTDHLPAISPYGLSKGLTSEVFSYFSELYQFHLGKFVIPNPYGPYEEGRFTSYLAKCWLNGKKATVHFPYYVRDNIPVSLLAKAYAIFAEELPSKPGFSKLSPSFQPESQGAFVIKFANELQKRFNTLCEYELIEQKDFPEPQVRINCDLINPEKLEWDESNSWNAIADFYLKTLKVSS